ncbi:MAG: hypothetical protein KKB15_00020 [Bacteroidetes bacterium]|nr:hypothetical protein [Bacteroidota bacterium]
MVWLKEVLIPVRHVKEFLWADSKINIDTTTAFIKDEPSFEEESFANPLGPP